MSGQRCHAMSKQSGEQCRRWAIPGGTVCVIHGGKSPQARQAAARRLALAEATADLTKLGRPVMVEPAEAMLEMVYEAAGNVAFLRGRVQQLEQRVGDGGIAGLVGSVSKPGEALPHVLVVMYDAERERLVRWAKACRDAGVDERRVQVAESQGRQLATVLAAAFTALRAALEALGAPVEVVEVVWREQLPGIVRGAIAETVEPQGEDGEGAA